MFLRVKSAIKGCFPGVYGRLYVERNGTRVVLYLDANNVYGWWSSQY